MSVTIVVVHFQQRHFTVAHGQTTHLPPTAAMDV
jgi:hypothetical protein